MLSFDEPIYDDLVTNMLTGHGYVFSGYAYFTALPFQPTSLQEPLYPLFLAAIYKITGLGAILAARIVQAVMNTITLGICAWLANLLAGQWAWLGTIA